MLATTQSAHEVTGETVTESSRSEITVRPIRPADSDEVARILFQAFAGIHDEHRFARDFPTLDAAAQLARDFIAHPLIWGVVAEREGRVVGSNFVDERGPVRGVGPITVDPHGQARGVGRRLMMAVIERSAGALGVRLLQDAFNMQSLALYASLGFTAREPVIVMGGRPRRLPARTVDTRALQAADLEECDALHRRIHGFSRLNELQDAFDAPTLAPFVATRGGRIVAYATGVTFFASAHAVAESGEDMFALLTGALADTDSPASFLLPIRQAELFRACLATGLRAVKPMIYMTIGEYSAPRGAWVPTVLY